MKETSPEAATAPLADAQAWKTWAPWVGAAAVVAWLLSEVPLGEVLAASREASLGWFLSGILGGVAFWFLLDSLGFSILFTRFNTPFSWAEARALRGVTYLLAAINWNVGTAGIILFLQRFKRVPALESTSSILFYSLFDTVALLGMGMTGALVLETSAELARFELIAGGIIAALALFLLVLVLDEPAWGWLQRVRGWSVFRTYRAASWRDYVLFLALRLGYFFGFVLVFYFGAAAFGLGVSLPLAMASVPLILLAGALPITPGGIGTQAAAMLYFWPEAGERGAVVALGLLLPFALTGARVLLGLPYLTEFRRLNRPTE